MRPSTSPPRSFPALAGALALGALTLAAPRAEAYDVLAAPCLINPYLCEAAPVAFAHTDAAPIQWTFDTGWVPQGSPLEVHIWSHLWANTHVALAGSLESTWPAALTLEAPGAKEGGDFGFHYGADFGAQGMVAITVLGQKYSWTGDLPFVPQFDFEVKADQPFDAWAYAPGVKLSSKTVPQKIAKISIADIIGSSIPGIDGGFELDVAVELAATYVTDQVVVATTDGAIVSGGPLTAEGQTSFTPYMSGPSIELDVHPEGTVDYDGTLHLVPAFYVSLLGQSWKIPVADIPIAFPITKTPWVFDKQRVHVPLPDLVVSKTTIDFGDVEVGQKSLVAYTLFNAGEAAVAATISSSDPDDFPPWDTALAVDPSVTADTAVRFIPTHPGTFTAKLLIASNDPSSPLQLIELKGRAPDFVLPIVEEDSSAAVTQEEGSCSCRAAGQSRTEGRGATGAAALIVLGAAIRRRRARRA